MQREGVLPDAFTLPQLNRAASTLDNHLRLGEAVHCIAFRLGFSSDVYFCNTLIETYLKRTGIDVARHLFDEMPLRDSVSWTSIILGYTKTSNVVQSFALFNKMRMEGFEPNSVTVVVMFHACSLTECETTVSQLHCYSTKHGLERYQSVQNSIMTVYARAGNFNTMIKVFERMETKDTVSWNIMLSMYSKKEDSFSITSYFNRMRLSVDPNFQTISILIFAFSRLNNLLQGKNLHGFSLKTGLIDMVVHNSLMTLYANCGDLPSSIQLFQELPEKKNMSYSTMMSCFIQNGHSYRAIELISELTSRMLNPNISVDALECLLLACSDLGLLRSGKEVHGYATRNNYLNGSRASFIETSLVNMYSKCGDIVSGRRFFDLIAYKDVVAWSSMIEGYGIHGFGYKSLQVFDEMVSQKYQPNSVTFLSLLSACSHSGLVSEGLEIFNKMKMKYGFEPELQHYTCLVDLLGRSGNLKDALFIIKNMKKVADGRIWGSLLASCRTYGDIKLGEYAAQKIFEVEPDNVGYITVLRNAHSSEKKWKENDDVVVNFKYEKGFKKIPGWSCIEVSGKFHGFVAGDQLHQEITEIRDILVCLNQNIAEIGAM